MKVFTSNRKPINVYWSPYFEKDAPMDWSFLYPKPETLFSTLIKNKSDESKNGSFTSCPAFYGKSRKILVFNNAIKCSYEYEATEDTKTIQPTSEISIEVHCRRPKSLNFGPTIEIMNYNLLFSDESLEISVTPPFFHEPKYLKYGSPVPGEYDIGKWLRPLSFEIQMWKNKGELHFEEDEPLFYAEFKTKRPIHFYRFELTDKILSYVKATTHFSFVFGKNIPLLDRYKKFNQVGYREKILTEIKKNLIDEEPYKF